MDFPPPAVYRPVNTPRKRFKQQVHPAHTQNTSGTGGSWSRQQAAEMASGQQTFSG